MLHLCIRYSSSFTLPYCMYSSSKQCTNWCAISRAVLPRCESSYNSNPSIFYFRVHWPVFVLGSCTLKWSVLSLCYGIISSGFCFSFGHIWRLFLITNNSLLSHSYSLIKYNRWTCAFIENYTRASPIISSIFLRVFGDMKSSIERECIALVSHSDK